MPDPAMPDAVTLFVAFQPKPDKAAELERLLRAMCVQSRQEPGCASYDLYRSETGMLNLIEVYRDAASLAFHRETPHLLDFRARLPELLERPHDVHKLSGLDVAE